MALGHLGGIHRAKSAARTLKEDHIVLRLRLDIFWIKRRKKDFAELVGIIDRQGQNIGLRQAHGRAFRDGAACQKG